MRFIRRNPIYSPAFLQESDFRGQLKELSRRALDGEQVRGEIYDLIGFIQKHVYHELHEEFANKCAYCEIELTDKRGMVDWFRPAFGAQREKGRVDQLHYIWLVGEWENLYLCCSECNSLKRNLFPASSPIEFGASVNQLRLQREAKLIDVCWDNPEQHLMIMPDGTFRHKNLRGELTIELLALNRESLCLGRRNALERFLVVWNDQIRRLHGPTSRHFSPLYEALDQKAPFIGSVYLFLWQLANSSIKKTLRVMIDLGPSDNILQYLLQSFGTLSIDLIETKNERMSRYEPQSNKPALAFRPVSKVRIKNFKGIQNLVLEIPRSTDQNLAIVGENAAGKTSVLQAIALGLAGPVEASRIVADARRLLFDGASEGHIVIEFYEERNVNELHFSLNSHRFFGNDLRKVKVFGYGPYRLLAKREIGMNKRGLIVRLSSLFDDGAKLNGYHGWTDSLNIEQKKDMAEVLKLLLVSSDTHVSIDSRSLQIRTNGKVHPIDSLSSGMQSVVSMCTDLMEALYSAGASVLKDGFVFIVDELDAHLHPAWRLGILPRLQRAFPNAQIIFSTHDPLTLRGMRNSQIHVLARDNNGSVHETLANYFDGQSIDQVLTSPVFGLFSTQTIAWESQYKEYINLLLKSDRGALNHNEKKDLERLVEELKGGGLLGETPREQLMYAVVDRFLARKKHGSIQWDEKVVNDLATSVQRTIDNSLEDEN